MTQPINPYKPSSSPFVNSSYNKEIVRKVRKTAGRIKGISGVWIFFDLIMIIASIVMVATGYSSGPTFSTITTIVVVAFILVIWFCNLTIMFRDVIPIIDKTDWIFPEPNNARDEYIKNIKIWVLLPIPYLSIIALILSLRFALKFNKVMNANKDKWMY